MHNSQFMRRISCIFRYKFPLVYRAIFRLVFRVLCMSNTINIHNQLIVVYVYTML